MASHHDVSYNGSSPLAKIMHSSATVRSSDIAFHLTAASLLDERSSSGGWIRTSDGRVMSAIS